MATTPTPGDDDIQGTSGPDVIFSGAGNDRILGMAGGDTLVGGLDNDVLRGGTGDDALLGGDVVARLDPEGRDQLFGDDGNDNLTGGKSVDLLSGGAGADRFHFLQSGSSTSNPTYDSGVGSGNRDRIIDFNSAEGDRIDLRMDADITTLDFDPFQFVGKVDPGQALGTGQLGWFESNGSTIVTANTDAAPGSTFEIQLDGVGLGLKAGDFVS